MPLKKRGIRFVIALLLCVISVALLLACSDGKREDERVQITLVYGYDSRTVNVSIQRGDVLPAAYIDIERNGFIFEGWFDNGEKWTEDTPIYDDLVLVAQWRRSENKNTFRVEFLNPDQSVLDSVEVEEGETAHTSIVPYLDDYHRFTGWSNDLTEITGNISVYPLFEYNSTDLQCFTFTEAQDGYVITQAVAQLPDVLCLPKTYNGRPVIGIDNAETYQNGVFALRDNLTKVYIPSCYRFIGDYAFYRAKNVLEINFEDESELAEIGVMSFAEVSIDSIALPSSKPETKLKLSTGAFMNCYYLDSILLNESVYEIGVNAFYNAGATTTGYYNSVSLTLPPNNSLVSIRDYAFANSAITGSLVFDNLRAVGNYAFSGNLISSLEFQCLDMIGQRAFYPYNVNGNFQSRLSSLKLGESLRSIGAEAFSYSGISVLELPQSLASIGSNAFFGSRIVALELPLGLSSIGERAFASCRYLSNVEYNSAAPVPSGAFADCQALATVEFSEGVTSFGDNAFRNCQQLRTVSVPDSLTRLGKSVFEGCSSLTDFSARNVEAMGISAFRGCSLLRRVSFEALSAVSDYSFYECANLEWVEIESETTYIGNCAFYHCSRLSELTIPSTVSYIGDNAMEETGLTVFRLPSAINALGVNAFRRCVGLSRIILPADVGRITFSDGVFSECSLLNEITVESGNAFYSNQNSDGHLYNYDGSELVLFVAGVKTSYVTPNTLVRIGNGSFSGNSYLQSLTIGSSVTEIGDRAFSGSETDPSSFLLIKSVDFSDAISLVRIGDYAFYNCNFLTELDLKACVSLKSLGKFAFYNCTSLKKLTLPKGLTMIGDSCFEMMGDSKHKDFCSLDLSMAELQSVGKNAFKNMDGLSEILLPNATNFIGEGAFDGCDYLRTVDIKSTMITNVANYTFRDTPLSRIVLPKRIESIGIEAFSGCNLSSLDLTLYLKLKTIGSYGFYKNELTCIKLPFSITYLGSYAFAENRAQMGTVNLSGLTELTVIRTGCFMNSGVTSLSLPISLTAIESRAFALNKLTQLYIPAEVTLIGSLAFEGNSLLSSVVIGDGDSKLETVEAGAFNNCISLKSVTLYASEPPVIDGPVFSFSLGAELKPDSGVKIYVKDNSFIMYRIAWAVHAMQIYPMGS